METRAFLFPGQGAQHSGMGLDIYQGGGKAAEIFDRAEAATGLPIKKLCFEGPEEELTLTSNAQPCIFTHSAALLEILKDRAPKPDVCAGLSLGEYTALYAAGSFDFETGVQLVARRGHLMQQAATMRKSGMVAVIGLNEEKINELCSRARQGQILTPANFNCPGQIVISGDTDACNRAARLAEEEFEARATVLKVAGAFHSDIMAPAAEKLGETLANTDFREPGCRVIANVDATFYKSASEIPEKLIAQLTGAIRWQQSMEQIIAEGLDLPYEIGPGKTLSGMMRRIDRSVRVSVVNSLDAISKFFDLG